MIIYYDAFHITIIDYLEFSEIITSFLEDLMFCFFTIALGYIVFGIVLCGEKDFEPTHETISKEKQIMKRLWLYIRRFPVITLWIITPGIVVITSHILKTPIHVFLPIILFSIISFITMVIIDESRHKYKFLFKSPPHSTGIILGSFFIILLIVTVFNAASKIISVKKDKEYYNVKFQIDDNVVISDSTYYFIGKTQNYLFVYNEKNNETSVIPMNRIKMITFPKRK